MEISDAKKLVIKAGLEVVKSGLIARTWGNISCRVDDKSFVITPSGMAYETLEEKDIVLINTEDLSYEGSVKPSSEKGAHAIIYRLRPDCNFVIHTHQIFASVVSALDDDITEIDAESAKILDGHTVPLAKYGITGTSGLANNIGNAVKRVDSKCALLANHGAICFGATYDEAFAVARELEKVCENHIKNRYTLVQGSKADSFEKICDYIGSTFKCDKAASAPNFTPCSSERDGTVMNIREIGSDKVARINISTGELISGGDYPEATEMHREIYLKRKDINYISQDQTPAEMAISKTGRTLKPRIDDFAQLIGPSMKSATFNPNSTLKTSSKVRKKLKKRNAVILNNNGVLCAAGSEFDEGAVEIIVDKECKAEIGYLLFEKGKTVNPIMARIERFVYLKKYSKVAKK